MSKFFFRDTKFIFRIIYFITAMIPSLLIFFVLNYNSMKSYILSLKNSHIVITILLLILIIFIICTINVIYQCHRYKNRTIVIKHVIDVNDKTISLLTGIILPTVVSSTNNLFINFITYFCMLIITYKLMVRSSNSFPNLLLILLGYDLYKCKAIEKSIDILESKDDIFIFSNKELQEGEEIQLSRIANSGIYFIKESRGS